MILQALVQYYEALLARGEIDRPGWSKVNVSWRLDLNPDGSLFDAVSYTHLTLPTKALG